ncbi:MAG: MerR family transcriptional regulator [Candidatus Humimicrobiaceae bacterium]
MELYTIVELAKLLKIPESTARYYRDRHPEYFHFTGRGRRKMYLPETLEALRVICEQANNSRTAEQIEEALQARFNREINTDDMIVKTAANTAEEQQLKLMNTLTDTLSNIVDQKKEIQSLREEIKELREYIKTPLLKRIFKRG